MRDPRLSGPPLVLAAHGSADPRFAETVDAIARRLRSMRPGLEVRIGYLEHGPPGLAAVANGDVIVVPLLLSRGFHALIDIPAQAPGVRVTPALGPDPRLADAVADRLREAGYDGTAAVVLAAAGSSDDRALEDVRLAAGDLAGRLGVTVTAAFVSAGQPRVADIAADVVAAYLIAPGAFSDSLEGLGARLVSAPIGDHPAVAEVVLDRYDATCQDLSD